MWHFLISLTYFFPIISACECLIVLAALILCGDFMCWLVDIFNVSLIQDIFYQQFCDTWEVTVKWKTVVKEKKCFPYFNTNVIIKHLPVSIILQTHKTLTSLLSKKYKTLHNIFFIIVFTLNTMGYCHCWKLKNLKFKPKHEEGEKERKKPTFTCSFFNYCMLLNVCHILGNPIPVQIRNWYFLYFLVQ